MHPQVTYQRHIIAKGRVSHNIPMQTLKAPPLVMNTHHSPDLSAKASFQLLSRYTHTGPREGGLVYMLGAQQITIRKKF